MLSIKDLSASKELDRAAMSAVAGGEGFPSFFQYNYANDLYDVLGYAAQTDVTTIAASANAVKFCPAKSPRPSSSS